MPPPCSLLKAGAELSNAGVPFRRNPPTSQLLLPTFSWWVEEVLGWHQLFLVGGSSATHLFLVVAGWCRGGGTPPSPLSTKAISPSTPPPSHTHTYIHPLTHPPTFHTQPPTYTHTLYLCLSLSCSDGPMIHHPCHQALPHAPQPHWVHPS